MNYEVAQIENLIEKYFNAETSLQEEALLKNYFSSDKVAAHLKTYQGLFGYFSSNQAETYSKNIRLKTGKSRRIWFSGIAAGLAILLAGSFYFKHYQEQKKAEKTLADTKMALELIAKQLNKGNKAINELQNVDKTTNKAFGISTAVVGK
jgi:hypothetical protein